MKYLVVGDLHGKFEIAEAALKAGEDNDAKVVFVGDYLDSYTRSSEDCVKTLNVVLEAIADGKAVGCWGNHDRQYVDPIYRCSGYDFKTQQEIGPLKDSMTELLTNYFWANGYLISHAGVSQSLLRHLDKSLEEYLKDGDFDQIGWSRGGLDEVGGLYWCDWRSEFEPIPGVKQIVGHTGDRYIREVEGNYCIDCLRVAEEHNALLINDDGEASLTSI